MKKLAPFFSVIICTFNRAKLLTRALKSLEKQSFTNFEVILVDDGSTDATREAVKKFKNIKYFFRKKSGLAKSRNFGLSKCAGKYITFLDSDDEYLAQHLEVRAKILVKNPQIEILHGGFKVVGSQYVPDYFNQSKKIHISKIVLGSTFFIKRGVFKKIGKFKNLKYGEDTDFFYRAKEKNIKITKINKKTYIYHRHKNSITGTNLQNLSSKFRQK